ncbi:MAG: class I SAM-dependent methyltransferase [Anaerolineales bacterium]|nr:class I SAM-dependent methyltransferase [Anaerolineales bacterium]
MINKLLFHQFPTAKSLITRVLYDLITTLDKDKRNIFLNYGYANYHDEMEHQPLPLAPEDEPHRYPLQLYYHVAQSVDWKNMDALEVSSGRGGGAYFVMRHFKPKSYTALDFSKRAIDFCKKQYKVDGLNFHHGNAEALPFPDASFDVVMNVEASLYYPNIQKFFDHVKRVLRPNGYFLYTDLRYVEKVDEWRAKLRNIGLNLIKEEEITNNVLKAMEHDRERRFEMVQKYAPRLLRTPLYDFVGLDPNAPLDVPPHLNKRRYWNFVFQKID